MPYEPGPGFGLPGGATGWNMTAALSTGLPSTVTRPETEATGYSLLQPARSRLRAAILTEPRHMISSSSQERSFDRPRTRKAEGDCSEARKPLGRPPPAGMALLRIDEHFTTGDGSQGREHGVHIDARGNRADRAVAHGEIQLSAGMEAAPAALALVGTVGGRRSGRTALEVGNQRPA